MHPNTATKTTLVNASEVIGLFPSLDETHSFTGEIAIAFVGRAMVPTGLQCASVAVALGFPWCVMVIPEEASECLVHVKNGKDTHLHISAGATVAPDGSTVVWNTFPTPQRVYHIVDPTRATSPALPNSACSQVAAMLDNRLQVRNLLYRADLDVPVTLALHLRGPALGNWSAASAIVVSEVAAVEDPQEAGQEPEASPERANRAILNFLTEHPWIRRVVVKGCGPRFKNCREQKFFAARELPLLTEHVLQLLAMCPVVLIEEHFDCIRPTLVLEQREARIFAALQPTAAKPDEQAAILLQDAISQAAREAGAEHEPEHCISDSDAAEVSDDEGGPSLGPRSTVSTINASAMSDLAEATQLAHLSFNVRVNVVKSADGLRRQVSSIVCCVGPAYKPVAERLGALQTLADTLSQWGITDESLVEQVHVLCRSNAFKATDVFQRQCSQDWSILAVDMILTRRKGRLAAIVLDVSGVSAVLRSVLMESLHPSLQGTAVRPWVQVMLSLSQRMRLTGRTIVVLGAGWFSKQGVFRTGAALGVKLVVVDPSDGVDHPIRKLCAGWVQFPELTNHEEDEAHVKEIVDLLHANGYGNVDGAITFSEDLAPLCSRIQTAMNLTGNSTASQLIAKSKFETHMHLKQHGKRGVSNYAAQSERCTTVPELVAVLSRVTLPVILKPEYGCQAVGVTLVFSVADGVAAFQDFQRERQEVLHPGCGEGFGNAVVVMPYLAGSEHDVDLVLYRGQLISSVVSDNGPTRLPRFSETTACMPSSLHPNREEALVQAAYQIVRCVGLTDGAVNVEMKMTSVGPRLIEINARMGGYYNSLWIKQVWGLSMVELAYMVASNIQPVPVFSDGPLTHIVGIMTYPSQHGAVLKDPTVRANLRRLHDGKAIVLSEFHPDYDHDAATACSSEEPISNIACRATSLHAARESLLATLDIFKLNSGAPNTEWFLRHMF